MTLPEVLLWRELRRERFKNWKFRRQMPVGPFIADFGCVTGKLIIEVDGSSHAIEDVAMKDERRSAYLSSQGYAVIRIPAADILRDLNGVIDGLAVRLSGLTRI